MESLLAVVDSSLWWALQENPEGLSHAWEKTGLWPFNTEKVTARQDCFVETCYQVFDG